MLAKRIIPCLDIKDGRTVKGIHFENLVDTGDPVKQAALYAQRGADEIVFLDISASQEKRKTLTELTRDVAREVNVPFTVGGGIASVQDVARLLEAGADKISINSAAVRNPKLIDELASEFGSQCITVAIDAKKIGNQWHVYTHGGKVSTERKLFEWAKECQERGAGEILFTSMDHDGTKNGFAIDALQKLNMLLNIPVIASGGAGNMGHFMDVFTLARADAALAAGVFHYGEIDILSLKEFLKKRGISIR